VKFSEKQEVQNSETYKQTKHKKITGSSTKYYVYL